MKSITDCDSVNLLSPNSAEMRRLIEIAMKFIIPHQAHPDTFPLNGSGVEWLHFDGINSEIDHAVKLAKSVAEPLPEKGHTDFEKLLRDIFDRLVPHSTNDNSGGYLAYIPSGGLFHSVLADFISLSLNRYVTMFMAAPGLAAIEDQVVRWLCDIIGFPDDAGGVLTSGGSIATINAIHAARNTKLTDINWFQGTIYVSEQAHHCIEQGLVLCGFPQKNIRKIATDNDFRIRIALIEKAIERDKIDGLHPFLLVATAGTTNTGAVDNIQEIGKLAKKYTMWFHVDAAYGGFFMLTERGKSMMKGIEQADSVVIDPHKGLFLPYGTGALLVKDKNKLRTSFDFTGTYLPVLQNNTSSYVPEDIMHLSPELTRDFRGFRIWLPLKMLGIKPFREQLDEKLNLAQWVTEQLLQILNIRIVAHPQLSILAFKLEPSGYDLSHKELDKLNIKLLDAINRRGNILLSPFKSTHNVDGEFAIRIAILSFRTTKLHLEQGISDIQNAISHLI
ncbi:MAG: aminotransferase class V-fold PLP-dependent enzyme [Candidatus Parabeggiatoa sp.]|nr:aminotransferase class V-fold PLP-dependent enzyme [Candidatus Parabeggiatoa sp.]